MVLPLLPNEATLLAACQHILNFAVTLCVSLVYFDQCHQFVLDIGLIPFKKAGSTGPAAEEIMELFTEKMAQWRRKNETNRNLTKETTNTHT